MSKIYINEILPRDATGITIPGHVVGYKSVSINSPITISAATSHVHLMSMSYTPVSANSRLVISINMANLRKTSGAGTNSWFSGNIRIDGVDIPEGIFGAVGYPETFADHRYNIFTHIDVASYSGTKTIAFLGSSNASGSDWVVSYQGQSTRMTVMEIAQ